MLLSCTIKNGKIVEDLQFLQDGQYLIKVMPFKDKSRKQYQENYFALIDEYSLHSGNNRYIIHALFKKASDIESIKDISLKDWPQTIENLKFYLLDK